MAPASISHRDHKRLVSALSSFPLILTASVIIRVALIVYSEWHDARSVVKYTDVDYRVFSDAARFTLNPTDENKAEGPIGRWLGLGEYVIWLQNDIVY